MEFKKLNKYQYEIETGNYTIYICKEKNPGTEYYLYFVDVFDYGTMTCINSEPYDSEVFDDMHLAIEYINNNYTITKKIYNKLINEGRK